MSTRTTARLQSGRPQPPPSADALAVAQRTALNAYCRCRKSSKARLSSMAAVQLPKQGLKRASGLCLHLQLCRPAGPANGTTAGHLLEHISHYQSTWRLWLRPSAHRAPTGKLVPCTCSDAHEHVLLRLCSCQLVLDFSSGSRVRPGLGCILRQLQPSPHNSTGGTQAGLHKRCASSLEGL